MEPSLSPLFVPPMKAARSHTAVVSTSDGESVVVMGGDGVGGGGGWTTTVELFQVKRRRWCKVTGLPQSLSRPSATICDNHIHIIDIDDNGYSCSVQDLPITSHSTSHPISWSPLPLLPVTSSTAATLCGQLVIIGGEQGGSSVNSIYQLVDGQWVEIDSMTRDKDSCLVVNPSPDKMMIVGGWREIMTPDVEECVVVQ